MVAPLSSLSHKYLSAQSSSRMGSSDLTGEEIAQTILQMNETALEEIIQAADVAKVAGSFTKFTNKIPGIALNFCSHLSEEKHNHNSNATLTALLKTSVDFAAETCVRAALKACNIHPILVVGLAIGDRHFTHLLKSVCEKAYEWLPSSSNQPSLSAPHVLYDMQEFINTTVLPKMERGNYPADEMQNDFQQYLIHTPDTIHRLPYVLQFNKTLIENFSVRNGLVQFKADESYSQDEVEGSIGSSKSRPTYGEFRTQELSRRETFGQSAVLGPKDLTQLNDPLQSDKVSYFSLFASGDGKDNSQTSSTSFFLLAKNATSLTEKKFFLDQPLTFQDSASTHDRKTITMEEFDREFRRQIPNVSPTPPPPSSNSDSDPTVRPTGGFFFSNATGKWVGLISGGVVLKVGAAASTTLAISGGIAALGIWGYCLYREIYPKIPKKYQSVAKHINMGMKELGKMRDHPQRHPGALEDATRHFAEALTIMQEKKISFSELQKNDPSFNPEAPEKIGYAFLERARTTNSPNAAGDSLLNYKQLCDLCGKAVSQRVISSHQAVACQAASVLSDQERKESVLKTFDPREESASHFLQKGLEQYQQGHPEDASDSLRQADALCFSKNLKDAVKQIQSRVDITQEYHAIQQGVNILFQNILRDLNSILLSAAETSANLVLELQNLLSSPILEKFSSLLTLIDEYLKEYPKDREGIIELKNQLLGCKQDLLTWIRLPAVPSSERIAFCMKNADTLTDWLKKIFIGQLMRTEKNYSEAGRVLSELIAEVTKTERNLEQLDLQFITQLANEYYNLNAVSNNQASLDIIGHFVTLANKGHGDEAHELKNSIAYLYFQSEHSSSPEAINWYLDFAKMEPETAEGKAFLGMAEFVSYDWKAAEKHLDEAIEMQRNHALANSTIKLLAYHKFKIAGFFADLGLWLAPIGSQWMVKNGYLSEKTDSRFRSVIRFGSLPPVQQRLLLACWPKKYEERIKAFLSEPEANAAFDDITTQAMAISCMLGILESLFQDQQDKNRIHTLQILTDGFGKLSSSWNTVKMLQEFKALSTLSFSQKIQAGLGMMQLLSIVPIFSSYYEFWRLSNHPNELMTQNRVFTWIVSYNQSHLSTVIAAGVFASQHPLAIKSMTGLVGRVGTKIVGKKAGSLIAKSLVGISSGPIGWGITIGSALWLLNDWDKMRRHELFCRTFYNAETLLSQDKLKDAQYSYDSACAFADLEPDKCTNIKYYRLPYIEAITKLKELEKCQNDQERCQKLQEAEKLCNKNWSYHDDFHWKEPLIRLQAHCKFHLKKFPEAKKMWQLILDSSPNDVDAHISLAHIETADIPESCDDYSPFFKRALSHFNKARECSKDEKKTKEIDESIENMLLNSIYPNCFSEFTSQYTNLPFSLISSDCKNMQWAQAQKLLITQRDLWQRSCRDNYGELLPKQVMNNVQNSINVRYEQAKLSISRQFGIVSTAEI